MTPSFHRLRTLWAASLLAAGPAPAQAQIAVLPDTARAASAAALGDTARSSASPLGTALPDSAAAARTAAEARFDSVLTARADVLAAAVDEARGRRPWWRRWGPGLLIGLGFAALGGLGAWAAQHLRDEIAASAGRGGMSPKMAEQAAERAATQAVATVRTTTERLSSDVNGHLKRLAALHRATEAELTQTRNLLDRAERLGLFRATLTEALAGPTDPTPDAPSAQPAA